MLSALMISCGSNDTPETTSPATPETPAESCIYTLESATASVNWTAYKLSKKAPVKGKFDSLTVSGGDMADSPEEVLAGVSFEINTQSVNSGDAGRDVKLRRTFFGNLVPNGVITGTIDKVEGKKAEVTLTINGNAHKVEAEVVVENDEIQLRTTLDVPTLGGQIAMDSLSVVCAERHTGDDGVNQLWPDVAVLVSAKVGKSCN